jgi:hypothetical protein
VAHVRVVAADRAAGALDHVVPRRAGLAAGPLVVAQVGERDPLLARGRVPDRNREHERVAAQLALLECRVARPRGVVVLLGEHHVDVAQAQPGQRVLGLGLHEIAVQLRMAGLERPERRDHERVGRRLERGHAHAARDLAGGPREVGLGRLELGDDRVGVADEPAAGLRELHSAPDALDQPHAGVALERGELLGDRRRRVGERLGDGGDGAARGELAQQAQATDVEHVSSRAERSCS